MAAYRSMTLAEAVGLSSPATGERLRKLEERGIVKGFTAILDAKLLGSDVTAFIAVGIDGSPLLPGLRRARSGALRDPGVPRGHGAGVPSAQGSHQRHFDSRAPPGRTPVLARRQLDHHEHRAVGDQGGYRRGAGGRASRVVTPALGSAREPLLNVNTPEDLARAEGLRAEVVRR